MKIILYTLFIGLLLTSCKKTRVVIQANDLVSGGGNAYAGMEYAVVEKWTPLFEPKTKIVHTGFLNENGHATFDIKMKNNKKYIVGVAQPDEICFGGLIGHYLEHDKNNLVNFNYASCGYLKFIRINTNCFDENDKIEYQRIWLTTNTLNPVVTSFGCTNYTGDFFSLPAGNYRYEWEVTRNGVVTNHSQDFTIPVGDSVIFELEY